MTNIKLFRNFLILIILFVLAIMLFSRCDINDINAREVVRLQTVNEDLQIQLDSAKWKLAKIDSIQQAMFDYADSTINIQKLQIVGLNGQVQSLQNEIFGLNNNLDSLLIQINNDIIFNIDSVYARVKRNGNSLIIN